MKSYLLFVLLLAIFAFSLPARADFNPFSMFDSVPRAAQKNDAEGVLKLVGRTDSNPDQTDDDGRTGLHYAAVNGNMRIAAILIRAGAKLNFRDRLGDTPLHLAADRNQPELARLLIEAGAAVDSEDKDGLTPLMFAARAGNLEMVRLLLGDGADPGKTDFTGRDAAGWAPGARGAAIRQALSRALAGHRE